ncbi:DEAD/DEAH box helicase [Bradyrhizobium japonicum]|uniref:DEAD/DEAH box helicase n=1 Tax=Bradyrhizobium japonicum TaxID=375 RepID=UPI0020117E1D|nr:DEAD/DEAH box helicase [Bradyrhizobium japonicum]
MNVPSPRVVIEYVRDAYQRYYDSAFWMRDEGIMKERKALLQEPGVMAQEPLIEAVPVYPSIESVRDVCLRANLSEAVAAELGKVVFGRDDIKLRKHQAEALEYALAGDGQGRKNIVVTSGTGSGKTESFLLPLIARLLTEREGQEAAGDIYPWWNTQLSAGSSEWKHLRSNQADTVVPAVRALVIYPTNALVEDQIGRLRQAAMRARDLTGKPKFYFGRYTSATLGGTYYPPQRLMASDRTRINEAGLELRKLSLEADELRRSLESGGRSSAEIIEAASQFPQPYCGEMLTRWDMIAAPPDVLITNTSMLNIMLLRDVETAIFDKTRRWLERDERNVFTFIVDELHAYRGTQGTEVALVLRNLLYRLGLGPESPQLRCIATSASLDGEPGREYLEHFFGVDRKSFVILPGEPREFDANLPLDAKRLENVADNILSGSPEVMQPALKELNRNFSPRLVLAAGCREAGTGKDRIQRPVRLDALKQVVLGGAASDRAMDALLVAAKLEDRGSWENPKPTFRSHMFLRQVQGVWACSNPNCDQVTKEFRSTGRAIGKLFKVPALKCRCGGQVLELLYCYDCGEAFLGGFVVPPPEGYDSAGEVFLESTKAGNSVVPPGMVYERTHREFRWYWPGGSVPRQQASWTHQGPNGQGTKSFSFNAGRLDPSLGILQLASSSEERTGVIYNPPNDQVAGLPECCPRCGSHRRLSNQRDLPKFYSGSVETPIRGLRTGLNATTQLVADRAAVAIGEDGGSEKMIAFTDSRDDAADLAAGLELHHFRDVIRQLIYQGIAPRDLPTSAELIELAKKLRDQGFQPGDERRTRLADEAVKDAWKSARLEAAGMADDGERRILAELDGLVLAAGVSWPSLLSGIRGRMVAEGINPGGTKVSVASYQNSKWWHYFGKPPGATWDSPRVKKGR